MTMCNNQGKQIYVSLCHIYIYYGIYEAGPKVPLAPSINCTVAIPLLSFCSAGRLHACMHGRHAFVNCGKAFSQFLYKSVN